MGNLGIYMQRLKLANLGEGALTHLSYPQKCVFVSMRRLARRLGDAFRAQVRWPAVRPRGEARPGTSNLSFRPSHTRIPVFVRFFYFSHTRFCSGH